MPPSQQFYRAIYAYPWDLVHEEPSRFGEIVSAQGISAVTLALSYHAGKFISPRSTQRRVYFPEDGAVYFNPTLSLATAKSNPSVILNRKFAKSQLVSLKRAIWK